MAFWDWIEKIAAKQYRAGKDALPIEVTGSSLQETLTTSQALPMRRAYLDVARRAYDDIIDIVGAENIKCLVPFWQTSGTETRDLINNNHTVFQISGVTFGAAGTPNPGFNFDGSVSYLIEKARYDDATSTAEVALDGPTKKFAQKLPANNGFNLGKVNLMLKAVGSISSADLKVDIVEDNAGQPTGTVVASSSYWPGSSIGSTFGRVGFVFADKPLLRMDKTYWAVLYYSTSTGVDTSNYVVVSLDASNALGVPMAVYDGTQWTVDNTKCATIWVYNDAFILPDDVTVIVAANLPATPWSATRCLWSLCRGYNNASFTQFDVEAHPTSGFNIQAAPINLITYRQIAGFHVVTLTFSKAKSTGKVNFYLDNRAVASADGSAEVAITQGSLPALVGARWALGPPVVRTTPYSGVMTMFGVIAKELTAAEVSKVASKLLVLRRLREAI